MKIEMLISHTDTGVIAALSAGQKPPEQPGGGRRAAPHTYRVCGIGVRRPISK